MKRAVVYGLTLALTLGIAQGQASQASGNNPASVVYASSEQKANRDLGPCDEERWLRITPTESTPQLVQGLIRCAVRRWPVDRGVSYAICIAGAESSWYPFAHGGWNLGVYQHAAPYWQGRVESWLRPEWFNRSQWIRIDQDAELHRGAAYVARANVIVAIRMVHSLPGGWDPWSTKDKC